MKKFQNPSKRPRRHPRPVARDIAIGHDNAKAINRGVMRLHLRPVRSTDHAKRYKPGQILNVRAFVGGPTWCKINVTDAARVPLTEALTLENAKLAGYRTSSELRGAFERSYGEGRSDRQVWVIRFSLDTTEAPRLLAESGDSRGRYRLGSDGRWQYVECHDERESDRGYTDTPARALREEPPALRDDDWARHVAKPAELRAVVRIAEQIAERAATSTDARLAQARQRATLNGYDMRDEFRRYDRLVTQGREHDALRQLQLIEQRVFPRAA